MQVGIGTVCVERKCVKMETENKIENLKTAILEQVEKAFDLAITKETFSCTQSMEMSIECSSGHIIVHTVVNQNLFKQIVEVEKDV